MLYILLNRSYPTEKNMPAYSKPIMQGNGKKNINRFNTLSSNASFFHIEKKEYK
jgi:hypothetical protein